MPKYEIDILQHELETGAPNWLTPAGGLHVPQAVEGPGAWRPQEDDSDDHGATDDEMKSLIRLYWEQKARSKP